MAAQLRRRTLGAGQPVTGAGRCGAVAAALVLIAGCRFHRPNNAPGLIDVTAAPSEPKQRKAEPGDPGERMLAVNPGVLAGGGAKTQKPHGFGEFGIEVSVNWGENERSHYGDDFFVYPYDGYGATIGWSAIRLERSSVDPEQVNPGRNELVVGPIYGEVHMHAMPWGGGVGWAVDPSSGDTGPQVFGYLSTLYVRGRYLFDQGAELSFGIQAKWPLVWIWSR